MLSIKSRFVAKSGFLSCFLSSSEGDKKHWVNTILSNFDKVRPQINSLAENRAKDLQESYDRLRKTIKVNRTMITPLLPADVLSISIIVPQPKI
jgi:phosphoheptose isomerase